MSRTLHYACYPATPVDCLLSELREMFGWDGSLTMTLADFNDRVAQFKDEIEGSGPDSPLLTAGEPLRSDPPALTGPEEVV